MAGLSYDDTLRAVQNEIFRYAHSLYNSYTEHPITLAEFITITTRIGGASFFNAIIAYMQDFIKDFRDEYPAPLTSESRDILDRIIEDIKNKIDKYFENNVISGHPRAIVHALYGDDEDRKEFEPVKPRKKGGMRGGNIDSAMHELEVVENAINEVEGEIEELEALYEVLLEEADALPVHSQGAVLARIHNVRMALNSLDERLYNLQQRRQQLEYYIDHFDEKATGGYVGKGSEQGRSKFFLRHDATIPFLVEYVNGLTDPSEIAEILNNMKDVKGMAIQAMPLDKRIEYYSNKLEMADRLKEMMELEYKDAFDILEDIRKGDGDTIQKTLVASQKVAQAIEDLQEFSTPQKLFERGIELADKVIDYLTSGTIGLSAGTTSYSFREEQKETFGEMFGKIGEIAGTVVGTLGEALGTKTFAQQNDKYVEQVIKSKYEAIMSMLNDYIDGLRTDIEFMKKSGAEFAEKRVSSEQRMKQMREYEKDVYWTDRLTDAQFNQRFPGVQRGSPYISLEQWLNKKQKKGKGFPPSQSNVLDEYFQLVNKSASKHGYSKPVPNKAKGKHKFTVDGVPFGSAQNLDYWFYKLSYGDKIANKKRDAYLKRSGKISGPWRSDPMSPNNLARRILWDAPD